jgi:hypothetical protein
MDAFNQGLLRAAEGVPQDLANSLLPALGDNKSWGWAMGNHEMWFSPPKPLHYFSLKNGCDLYRGSRAGLQPAQTWRGPFKALSPCGPQQLQQQQQVLDAAGLDMPGHWQEVASATGTLRWYMKGGYECMKLSSNALVRQLVPLAADHFLLRAQHTKVGCSCWMVLPHPSTAALVILIDSLTPPPHPPPSPLLPPAHALWLVTWQKSCAWLCLKGV